MLFHLIIYSHFFFILSSYLMLNTKIKKNKLLLSCIFFSYSFVLLYRNTYQFHWTFYLYDWIVTQQLFFRFRVDLYDTPC